MPRPSIPVSIDGVSLTVRQRDWLDGLIETIWVTDPTRAAEAILRQSLRAFAKVHKKRKGRWIRRATIVLGGGSSGAILALAPDEE